MRITIMFSTRFLHPTEWLWEISELLSTVLGLVRQQANLLDDWERASQAIKVSGHNVGVITFERDK